eukprot:5447182-Amphidinium_carterae.1
MQQGLEVTRTVIGFTLESQAYAKLQSSTWVSLQLRAEIAQAVVADIGLTGVDGGWLRAPLFL